MFQNVGLRGSAGISAALIVGFGLLPIIALHIWGKKWRS
jgi:hypothetical protein